MSLPDLRPQARRRTPEELVAHLKSFELDLKFSAGVWFFSPPASRFHDRSAEPVGVLIHGFPGGHADPQGQAEHRVGGRRRGIRRFVGQRLRGRQKARYGQNADEQDGGLHRVAHFHWRGPKNWNGPRLARTIRIVPRIVCG